MCGRFTLTFPWQEVSEQFGVSDPQGDFLPYYNAAPGQQLAAITGNELPHTEIMHWGFPLNKNGRNHLVINARADSLEQKPLFREKLYSSRCIIPADSFYEWQKLQNKKLPYRFTLKNNKIFAFPGLFGVFKGIEGKPLKAFVIITTNANELVAKLHDRMPVMLTPEKALEWLKNDKSPVENEYLQPLNAEEMISYRVSTKVNSAANDSPDLIEPWIDPNLTLF